MVISQKDGSHLTVLLHGDEHFHYFTTTDNIPVGEGQDGSYYYIVLKDAGLMLSSVIAHDISERNREEAFFVGNSYHGVTETISNIWTNKVFLSNERRLSKIRSNTRGNALGESKTFKGKKKGLVILVNYQNKQMSVGNPQSVFDEMFNAVGYNKNNAVGSVHDYFYDQSYGQFDLSFDVVGPVLVSHDYSYYGSNGSSVGGGDLRADEMIVEACKLVDDEVDFANYDWDGDGEVDQVYVIYAGYGESGGGNSTTIWPHESHLEYQENGTLRLDGVTINTYACSSELAGGKGTTINGIGTACHEFSHCLGLPDFYDTSYSGGFGMGCWDIMSSGSHCGPDGNGEVPTGYSAYERNYAGWLEYEELNCPCVVSQMESIAETPVAYIIYNDNDVNEYFLLENRQNVKWFSYAEKYEGCHGLLVTHVDYSETSWRNNRVNTSGKHQRMTIIPADMDYGKKINSGGRTSYVLSRSDLQGDLFPGLLNIKELTNTSHDMAGGKLYNLNTDGSYFMNKPITEITEKDGLISFCFMGGIYVPTPENLSATEIKDKSFTANWNAVDGVDSYTLELSQMRQQGKPLDHVVLSEDLAKFKTKANTGDGYIDLSAALDNYMKHEGWSGEKIYTSPYGVKIGTTSAKGHLTSPIIKIEGTSITIRFTARALTSAGANIQFVAMTPTGTSIELQECKLNYQPGKFVVCFENLNENNLKLQITSPDRVYLSDIIVYDGYYVESDFENFTESTHMTGVHISTIFDIKDTKFELTGLDDEIYRYRVRANLDRAYSGWSEYVVVDLRNTTVIRPSCDLGETSKYIYYDLNGVRTSFSRAGIYLRKDENGSVIKVIKK